MDEEQFVPEAPLGEPVGASVSDVDADALFAAALGQPGSQASTASVSTASPPSASVNVNTPIPDASTSSAPATGVEAREGAQPLAADPLTDPRIQQAVEQAVTVRERQAQQARESAEREAFLRNLSDADYGRIARQHQEEIARYQTVAEAVQTRFYQDGYHNVISALPELQNLSTEAAQKLNPQNFNTYGDMVTAMVDYVATQRAKPLAEKHAKELAEAQVKSETARLRKELPSPVPIQGAGVKGGQQLSAKTTSADDLFRAAFTTR